MDEYWVMLKVKVIASSEKDAEESVRDDLRHGYPLVTGFGKEYEVIDAIKSGSTSEKKCPACGSEMVVRTYRDSTWLYCIDCSYQEEKVD
jgi:hypothetical protein